MIATRLYSDFAQDPVILNSCSGFAHITGGGIVDNLPRISLKTLQLGSNWSYGRAYLSEVGDQKVDFHKTRRCKHLIVE